LPRTTKAWRQEQFDASRSVSVRRKIAQRPGLRWHIGELLNGFTAARASSTTKTNPDAPLAKARANATRVWSALPRQCPSSLAAACLKILI
jgi:hypothetical protein